MDIINRHLRNHGDATSYYYPSAMTFADGVSMTVQGCSLCYSSPVEGLAPPYERFEVSGTSMAIPELSDFEREGAAGTYMGVPLGILVAVAKEHGEIVDPT